MLLSNELQLVTSQEQVCGRDFRPQFFHPVVFSLVSPKNKPAPCPNYSSITTAFLRLSQHVYTYLVEVATLRCFVLRITDGRAKVRSTLSDHFTLNSCQVSYFLASAPF